MVNFIALTENITEHKRAEDERSLLATIVESSEDAIIGRRLDGTIISWNLGAGRIFGYKTKEAIGRLYSFLVPKERLNELEEIREKLTQGERVEHYESGAPCQRWQVGGHLAHCFANQRRGRALCSAFRRSGVTLRRGNVERPNAAVSYVNWVNGLSEDSAQGCILAPAMLSLSDTSFLRAIRTENFGPWVARVYALGACWLVSKAVRSKTRQFYENTQNSNY